MYFFARHFENRSSHIQNTYFYQYYIPVAHAESFRINISITAVHRITARILDAGNLF